MIKKLFLFVPVILVGIIPVSTKSSVIPQTPTAWVSYLAGTQSNHYPIVFVHGISAGYEKWDKTAQFISNSNSFQMRYADKDHITHNYTGIPPSIWVWNVSYYSPDILTESLTGDLTIYAKRLNTILDTISKITGQNQFILVAHSMGGLVARKAITLDSPRGNKVATLLTVGTPHEGVPLSIPVVGQLRDLLSGSEFLKTLDRDWQTTLSQSHVRWGVIGGVVTTNRYPEIRKDTTDFGGPGFVEIRSSIPFGEWQNAIKTIGIPTFNTVHFGFRVVVPAQHNDLLDDNITKQGIFWATSK